MKISAEFATAFEQNKELLIGIVKFNHEKMNATDLTKFIQKNINVPFELINEIVRQKEEIISNDEISIEYVKSFGQEVRNRVTQMLLANKFTSPEFYDEREEDFIIFITVSAIDESGVQGSKENTFLVKAGRFQAKDCITLYKFYSELDYPAQSN